MNQPICLKCSTPVKRMGGLGPYGTKGPRIVDGLRWRWYCCKSCAASDRTPSRDTMLKVARARVQAGQRRIMARLVAACKDHMDAQGKVDPRDFVKVMMRELQMQYQRQYQRGRFRDRKAA